MTAFDIAVLLIVGISVVLAFVRGFIREVFAIAAWIVAVVLAFRYSGPLATYVPGSLGPATRQVIAFVLILLVVLVVGGLVANLLAKALRAVGLGFLDRMLGGVFGFVRGALLVLLGILVAGLTSMPRAEWWQSATLSKPLTAAALGFRDWLPRAWADRLDYSGTTPMSKSRGTRAGIGVVREG